MDRLLGNWDEFEFGFLGTSDDFIVKSFLGNKNQSLSGDQE